MKKIDFCSPVFLRWALFLGAFLALSGCTAEKPAEEPKAITLMAWNLHNLFDGVDDGDEYSEFLQAAGWSAEKYKGRLNSISSAIGKIEPSPDIMIFEELESLVILEDLALVLPKGYLWAHFAKNNGSAIGLGILSRLPMVDVKAHSINIYGDVIPRPVLEARFQTEDGDFLVFACHWKSKIGDSDVTENIRMASARVILRRIREVWESEPEVGVIVAGDLNENYDEFYRQGSKRICALVPDDPVSFSLSNVNTAGQKDFIVISGNKPPLPVHFPEGTISLFSPWMSDLENGSFFYKNDWETIDHFLISGQFWDNSGWEYEGAFVANFEPFANSNGVPVPYNSRSGFGLSDHLPLIVTLRLVGGD
ncbi:MAG: endonuclease/exonuclease/phosphatase family protein [Treponema sp.]|nr:endonuclease/exonuclease/phosphatase family protein [Treponema sp.]